MRRPPPFPREVLLLRAFSVCRWFVLSPQRMMRFARSRRQPGPSSLLYLRFCDGASSWVRPCRRAATSRRPPPVYMSAPAGIATFLPSLQQGIFGISFPNRARRRFFVYPPRARPERLPVFPSVFASVVSFLSTAAAPPPGSSSYPTFRISYCPE